MYHFKVTTEFHMSDAANDTSRTCSYKYCHRPSAIRMLMAIGENRVLHTVIYLCDTHKSRISLLPMLLKERIGEWS